MAVVRTALHLTTRFATSLDPRGPRPADESWVESVLGAGELSLWRSMSGVDRRHAIGVARRVGRALGGAATPPVLAAALLHDVGKIEAGLGTFGRVPATLVGMVARDRAIRGKGRVSRYLRHDVVGAELLTAAGAHPLTIAWAAEHHLKADRWTLPEPIAAALKAADDD